MVAARAALVVLAVVAVGLAALSGGSEGDPRTPPALPGMPAPFLGTAVVGSGGLTAAIDAYGDVVDMRAPGPAGRALVDNPADRQAAGTVSPRTGIVPRLRIGDRPAVPLWEADRVEQHYLPETSVVRTVATFALGPGRRHAEVEITDAAWGEKLALIVRLGGPVGVQLTPVLSVNVDADADCGEARQGRALALLCSNGSEAPGTSGTEDAAAGAFAEAERIVRATARGDRRRLKRARPLGAGAPAWAEQMYRRSLLVLRALADRRSGALAAGLRDGWAYVWPRDAGAAALALGASGYRAEARRIAGFLADLDLAAAARFAGDGAPVPGREAQGDAAAWAALAARPAGLVPERGADQPSFLGSGTWRDRADYQEGERGDYLANAIANHEPQLAEAFGTPRGLARRAGDPESGLDSAAAWAVRPFPQPALFRLARKTLLALARRQDRFGITPGEGWSHADPWTAPTAWTAWSLAALGERRQALRLLQALHRAATPAGDLPERLDARTGIPRSTTPLAWSHAFAILALRELWPPAKGGV